MWYFSRYIQAPLSRQQERKEMRVSYESAADITMLSTPRPSAELSMLPAAYSSDQELQDLLLHITLTCTRSARSRQSKTPHQNCTQAAARLAASAAQAASKAAEEAEHGTDDHAVLTSEHAAGHDELATAAARAKRRNAAKKARQKQRKQVLAQCKPMARGVLTHEQHALVLQTIYDTAR